jgi:hypothetical protein
LGLPPKLRPINSGTLFSKTILAVVLQSAAGLRSKETTQPYQLALGTSRGTEKMTHICRAARNLGYAIGRNDYGNGFNSLSRQKMLSKHAEAFPEAVDIFNLFYGCRSPAFLIKQDGSVATIWSQEGSRQGCSASCETFCVAVSPIPPALI